MANHIFILATVMLLAGIFGGLVNYYLYGDKDPDAASLPRFLVVGVGASFLVPVVLDMVNSELVLESQGDPSRLLIFTGFCLISALLSRFFIDNLSDRILSEAKTAKQRSEETQQNLRIIQSELLPLIDTETEQDLSGENREEDRQKRGEETEPTRNDPQRERGGRISDRRSNFGETGLFQELPSRFDLF